MPLRHLVPRLLLLCPLLLLGCSCSVARAAVARELELEEVDESAEEAELMDCPAFRYGALQPAAAFAEAATEVGEALSAKDRHTNWEVDREGKQVREQWNTDFEASASATRRKRLTTGTGSPRGKRSRRNSASKSLLPLLCAANPCCIGGRIG